MAGPTIRISIVVAALLLPTTVRAQVTAARTASIDEAVSSGKRVQVETTRGETRKGTVFTISPTSLELVSGRRKEIISVRDISLIKLEYRDRISDGAKKGALTGLAIGAAFGAVVALASCGDRGGFLDFCNAGGFALATGAMGGYGVGIGAAAGAIGDAARLSTRIVWRAPATNSRVALRLLGGPGRTGARVVLSW